MNRWLLRRHRMSNEEEKTCKNEYFVSLCFPDERLTPNIDLLGQCRQQREHQRREQLEEGEDICSRPRSGCGGVGGVCVVWVCEISEWGSTSIFQVEGSHGRGVWTCAYLHL